MQLSPANGMLFAGTIALAEPDLAWRDEATNVLSRAGFKVFCADTLGELSPYGKVDLAILSLSLGEGRVIRFARNWTQNKKVPVAILATNPTVGSAMSAVQVAVDYIHKSVEGDALVMRCREAIDRGRAPRELDAARKRVASLERTLERLLPVPETAARIHEGWSSLSRREREIVDHVRQGMSTKEIASRFDLSPHTVRNHMKSAYKKFSVSGRAELMQTLLATREAAEPPRKPSPPRRFRRRAPADQPDA